MRGVLHVMERDLESGVEAHALANLMRLERLLKAHAAFEAYLKERD